MNNAFPVIHLTKDSTQIIPCRKGDVFIWSRNTAGMWDVNARYQIADIMVMNDGEQFLLTNRLEDVPEYVEITPQEAGGKNVRMMVERLNSEYSPGTVGIPLDELESAWRICMGDYVIWSGPHRQGEPPSGSILGIFVFEAGTLGICSAKHMYPDTEENFRLSLSDQGLQEIREAAAFIEQQGIDRRRALKWKLG